MKMREMTKGAFDFFYYFFRCLYLGIKNKKGKQTLADLIKGLGSFLLRYTASLKKMAKAPPTAADLQMGINFRQAYKIGCLQKNAGELHRFLSKRSAFSYSLLIVVEQIEPTFFKTALTAALKQTVPVSELLIGLKHPVSPSTSSLLQELQKTSLTPIKVIQKEGLSSACLFNLLAEEAIGSFLVLVGAEGWMQPDALFRFEQALCLQEDPKECLIYAQEYILSDKGKITGQDPFLESKEFYFPYCFATSTPKCFILSKELWIKIQGLEEKANECLFYDFFLRLDLAGAKMHKIPLFLSAHKERKKENADAAAKALKEYSSSKGLQWEISPGYMPGTLRALPRLHKTPSIHAIVLYKDQRELTLAAVQSLIAQRGAQLKITCVDNRSEDTQIKTELEKLKVEVLKVDEPFNFSRLNNLAVKESSTADSNDLLFFMNNDVILDSEALLEMSRWIGAPRIGAVGCRLHYPSGLLQCGGVEINMKKPKENLCFDFIESHLPFEALQRARLLRITDSLHGAALLIQKELFLSVGGFDEIWYPIIYSDVNLCFKLQKKGLWMFYTPFAMGTHHESASRDPDMHEAFEVTTWLHEQYFASMMKNNPLDGILCESPTHY